MWISASNLAGLDGVGRGLARSRVKNTYRRAGMVETISTTPSMKARGASVEFTMAPKTPSISASAARDQGRRRGAFHRACLEALSVMESRAFPSLKATGQTSCLGRSRFANEENKARSAAYMQMDMPTDNASALTITSCGFAGSNTSWTGPTRKINNTIHKR